MKRTVYLETSIVSYLTARLSSDIITAGHQLTTLDWWETQREKFDVLASELVIQEAALGDTQMAQKRLEVLNGIEILAVTSEARDLAKTLVAKNALPQKAALDALHISIAAVEKVDFLATWNFKHIANARMKAKIEEAIRAEGFAPSQICTLEELSGE